MTDEEAIRALIEARADAIRRKDAASAVALLADDVVAFEMVPPLALPPSAARNEAMLTRWLESWDGPIEIDIRDLTIHVGGRIAFAHSLNRLAGNRVGGGWTDVWMRSTLGFVLSAEGWRIVHAHTSVPFDPVNDFKARLDLEP
jgi:ketosteroid isomerase-like protein